MNANSFVTTIADRPSLEMATDQKLTLPITFPINKQLCMLPFENTEVDRLHYIYMCMSTRSAQVLILFQISFFLFHAVTSYQVY